MARHWVWELNNNSFFFFGNSTTPLARKSLTQFLFLCEKCALPMYIKLKKCVMCCRTTLPVFMPMVLAVQVGSTPLILHVTILWIWLPRITAILCKMQQATMIVQTLSGAILTSECNTWNLLFSTPKACSMMHLVTLCALLKSSSLRVLGSR